MPALANLTARLTTDPLCKAVFDEVVVEFAVVVACWLDCVALDDVATLVLDDVAALDDAAVLELVVADEATLALEATFWELELCATALEAT